MRILLDACVPVALKRNFVSLGHECQAVREAGFAGKKNSELLTLAEHHGDDLLTTDRKIQYRQTRDWAKDWDPDSAREDEPPAGSPAYFANLRASAARNMTRSGSRSRDVLEGF